MKNELKNHIFNLEKKGITFLKNVFSKSECNKFIKRFEKLTLEFENSSKLIINRQQPLHQIWLATLESGHHYNYINESWIDDRSGDDFLVFLSAAIFKQSQEKVNFRL